MITKTKAPFNPRTQREQWVCLRVFCPVYLDVDINKIGIESMTLLFF